MLTAHDLNRMIPYALPDEIDYVRNLSFSLGSWKTFVMIGAGPGVFALALMEGQSKHRPSTLWIIDHDPDQFHYLDQHMQAGEHPLSAVHYLVGDSAEAGKDWQGEISLLIVDGDHTLEGVLRDIQAWEPHVKVGGTIMFHDFLERPGGFNGVAEWKQGGVAEAVYRTLDEGRVDWEFLDFPGISLVVCKHG